MASGSRPRNTRACSRASATNGASRRTPTRSAVWSRSWKPQFARLLGKERAVFMPTGTLANHMAVRALANGPSRVIVQEDSHFYLDEGDCAQTLSNLTLMPLAPGRASFTADDVQHLLDQTKTGRVSSRVSVISIETPVRRKQGERFDRGGAGEDRRRWRAARASGCTSTGRGCFSRPPTPASQSRRPRSRSTPSTCRSTSISTRRPARSSPDRATCSIRCSTDGACSAAACRTSGRLPPWRCTTCRASAIASRKQSSCPKT